MTSAARDQGQGGIDLARVDFLQVFSEFTEGVIVTDRSGVIVFYNKTQAAIDDMDPALAVGKHITELYDLTEENSMILRCLQTREPILNQVFFYRPLHGRLCNAIHSVYPLVRGERLEGAICFLRDQEVLGRAIAASAALEREKDRDLGNGTRFTVSDIIGGDPGFLRCVERSMTAAGSMSPVMLCGETGTGKELFAQAVHNYSSRRDRPFVAVNCAAIPESLQESILFGTLKGAFTGAVDKPGLFEEARGGTLYLDEVDSMPTALQAKLLRVLQDRRVRRLGSSRETRLDVKILSSVNQDPRISVREGALRKDLYYRLGVVYIHLPPLRERKSDIEVLARHFLSKHNFELGRDVKGIAGDVLDLFQAYDWPGNVRELEHAIEGAMNTMGPEEELRLEHLEKDLVSAASQERRAAVEPIRPPEHHAAEGEREGGRGISLAEARAQREREVICGAMEEAGGRVAEAARRLGISRQLLHYKLRKLGLDPKSFR